mmetsp:Transcript_6015/g.19002  ORF Transcript_6015/g.19002 Transcript_6015/m.19002 type:complete len:202 (+) Transcript_6015:230-835(+)
MPAVKPPTRRCAPRSKPPMPTKRLSAVLSRPLRLRHLLRQSRRRELASRRPTLRSPTSRLVPRVTMLRGVTQSWLRCATNWSKRCRYKTSRLPVACCSSSLGRKLISASLKLRGLVSSSAACCPSQPSLRCSDWLALWSGSGPRRCRRCLNPLFDPSPLCGRIRISLKPLPASLKPRKPAPVVRTSRNVFVMFFRRTAMLP